MDAAVKNWNLLEHYHSLSYRKAGRATLQDITPDEAGAILGPLIGQATDRELETLADRLASVSFRRGDDYDSEYGSYLAQLKREREQERRRTNEAKANRRSGVRKSSF